LIVSRYVCGWVEVQDSPGHWHGVLCLGEFMNKGELALLLLFGGFGWEVVTTPVVPIRGFPPDLSPETARRQIRAFRGVPRHHDSGYSPMDAMIWIASTSVSR
jgi:hypothetical protein